MKQVEFKKDNLVPNEKILASDGKRHRLWSYGIEYWNEFFSDRQLLILSILLKKIDTFCASSEIANIADLKIYLSFLVARLVNVYSYGVYWDSSKEIPIPALAMRQPRIVFNLVETNPFEKVRGSLKNSVGNIVKAIEFCTRINNPVTCKRESVTENIRHKIRLDHNGSAIRRRCSIRRDE